MSDCWETIEDIQRAFEAAGITIKKSALERRLERRRDKGLLPPVDWDHPKGIRGSQTNYPVGTAAQAVEIERLLQKEKRKFERVGWELWWNGWIVDDRHWRPRLGQVAKLGDCLLAFLRFFMRRNERESSASSAIDQIAEKGPKQSILAKINRRVGLANLPAMWNMILSVAAGEFNSNLDASDRHILTKTFDFEQSEHDSILGKQLKLESTLPDILSELSDLAYDVRLSDVYQFSQREFEAARNDVRNAISIITDLYETTSWIYGPEAFGLRLAAGIARNSTPDMQAFCLLAIAARRRRKNSMYSSGEIVEMARAARIARDNSAALRELQKDPRFANVLSRKRLKRGLRNPDEQWELRREIEAAKLKR